MKKSDAEYLVVVTDLVSDLLRIADDRGIFECRVVGQRNQILADAPIELVLLRRHSSLVGDEACLLLKEPPDRFPHVVARLTGRIRHVNDLVETDVGTAIRPV
jgi:hypothetical protein